jgi:beta-1,2-mannobiose phosphorylase / 1,2-beta-oligomannan phosphorylase
MNKKMGKNILSINRRQFLALTSSGLVGLFLSSCDALSGLGIGSSTSPQIETSAGWQKYPQNPVLGGNLGVCFDVALLRENATYRMWFSWRPRDSIALVESQDGIHWNDPVIVLGPDLDTHWEDSVNRPVIVKNAAGYHLWYTGQVNSRSCIGYAVSSDGIKWKRTGRDPVLTPNEKWEGSAVMCPNVIFEQETQLFRMWYSAGESYEPNAIGYATSMDGRNWQKFTTNPVFQPATEIPWEKDRVTACQVIPGGDWYYMFYIGFQNVNTARIGLARSRDGIQNWQRHSSNPVIDRGNKGEWDADAAYKPYAIYDGQRWLLWYNGRNGSVEQIGLAIHEGQDLGF